MKVKHILSAFLGFALLLSSCESLDYTRPDQLSNTTFWKTELHAKQAAVGLYQAMMQPWCFGLSLIHI